jgi:phage gp36-like protein
MSYILITDLDGKVPAQLLLQALDDNGDGLADDGVWDKIVVDVESAINSRLEGNYAIPLAEPLPAIVSEAAKILAAEAVYQRRGLSGDQNPWVKQADAMRKRLEDIGSGDKPLKPDTAPQGPSGVVINETSRLNTGGYMML